ncbi:MAG: hypothetical protein QM642_04690 [Edaphocola sp.]
MTFVLPGLLAVQSCKKPVPENATPQSASTMSANATINEFVFGPDNADIDTLNIGDTLWIESQFDKQLYNEENGKTYPLENFDFGMFGAISDLSTNPQVGYEGFTIVDTNGVNNNDIKSGAYFSIRYTYDNGKCYWKKGPVFPQECNFLHWLCLANDSGCVI